MLKQTNITWPTIYPNIPVSRYCVHCVSAVEVRCGNIRWFCWYQATLGPKKTCSIVSYLHWQKSRSQFADDKITKENKILFPPWWQIIKVIDNQKLAWPYLTLFYLTSCSVLRPYQLGPMRIPKCNHKITGNGYKAVGGCEAVNRWL